MTYFSLFSIRKLLLTHTHKGNKDKRTTISSFQMFHRLLFIIIVWKMYDKMPFQFVFLVDTLLSFLCVNKKIAMCKAWCNRLLQSVWRLRGCLAERALVYAVLVAARGQGRWLEHYCALLRCTVPATHNSWSNASILVTTNREKGYLKLWYCEKYLNIETKLISRTWLLALLYFLKIFFKNQKSCFY